MPKHTSKRKASSFNAKISNVAYPANYLPTIDGPKLGPFRCEGFNSSSDLQFQQRIDEHGWTESGSEEGQGYVFKATLNQNIYAVKLFKFWDIEEIEGLFEDYQLEQMTEEEIIGNMDPFYAECRAYGRIKEIQDMYRGKSIGKSPIAVPCYGYVFISPSHERDILDRFGDLDFDRENGNEKEPIRALVKQYVDAEPLDINVRPVRLMARDLRTMTKHGLYPSDIHEGNYRGGLLVDFGLARTEPSCVLRVEPPHSAAMERGLGLVDFDEMIEDAGIKTKVRAHFGHLSYRITRGVAVRRGITELVELDHKRGRKPIAIVLRGQE